MVFRTDLGLTTKQMDSRTKKDCMYCLSVSDRKSDLVEEKRQEQLEGKQTFHERFHDLRERDDVTIGNLAEIIRDTTLPRVKKLDFTQPEVICTKHASDTHTLTQTHISLQGSFVYVFMVCIHQPFFRMFSVLFSRFFYI